ncbi:transcriptional regulator [Parafrankia sp. FMc2]|uniref:transcriptional regulator n=1 Tax=Parafrankia sp. FMc2 TaxID=3233196 RepID=UPI0034D3AC17
MASAMAVGLGSPSTAATGSDLADSSTVAVFQTLFENYRRLGQSVGPGVVLPALIAHTNTLRELSVHAAPRVRCELLRLGSRYAEYVGWLMQERGDDSAALWWTQRAVELAAAGGDRQLAAYAKVRHALVTLYRDEGDETVALARQARDGALPPRIRGLAVQREAQGHAINGDYDACMWCLDQARELLAAAVPDEGVPVIGSTNLSDSVGMITGWCLLDLGRPARAADVLDAQMRQVPAEAARTRARYGTRQARAHATAGDIEHACELARWVLPDVLAVSSATIAADLRELLRTLRRHPQNASVQELAPILTAALTVVTP